MHSLQLMVHSRITERKIITIHEYLKIVKVKFFRAPVVSETNQMDYLLVSTILIQMSAILKEG